jgi:hypothetical protein
VIFTSITFFLLWFCRLSATLVCSSSLCGVVCFSCFVHVFIRFKLSYQHRSGADPTLTSPMLQIQRWIFWILEYSHMCKPLYFAVLCYKHGCCDLVRRFILFVFRKFALYKFTLFEWMTIIYFCQKKKNSRHTINVFNLLKWSNACSMFETDTCVTFK